MYLIGITDGEHPAGKAGTMHVMTIFTPQIMARARIFGEMYDHDIIYAIPMYSQKMSEMDTPTLIQTVKQFGVIVYRRDQYVKVPVRASDESTGV